MARKRLNFECSNDTHAELVGLQAKLIRLGSDMSLNEILNGLIFYAREHGFDAADMRFFEHGRAEFKKSR